MDMTAHCAFDGPFTGACMAQELELEQDSAGLQRLKFRRQGWSYWKWDGHDIHYVRAGDFRRAQGCLGDGRLCAPTSTIYSNKISRTLLRLATDVLRC